MSKIVKQMELDALNKTFQGVRDLVLLTADKIGSQLDYNFRKSLRDKKVRLQMVKNSLARKVFESNGIKLDQNVWTGTTLVAWGADSAKELSNAVDALLKDIVKKNPKDENKYKIKTGVVDGQPIAIADMKKIPTRLEAIGEVIGMILGPASEIAGALTGPAGQVASQIATIAEKKEETPAPAA